MMPNTYGWPVFPCHSIGDDGNCTCSLGAACTAPGKHPRTVNGVKDATTDRDQIKQWAARWPGAINWAVATGKASGVFVVDDDGPKHDTDALSDWMRNNGPLPETFTVQTGGGGTHRYFNYPSGGTVPGRNSWLQHVDVKSDGGYVLLPDSRHVSGGTYKLVTPAEVRVAEAPTALLADIRGRSGSSTSPGDFDFARVIDGLPKGQRDEGLFRFACSLRRKLHDDRDLITGAVLTVAARCVPPFPEDEALQKVESAFRQDHDSVAREAREWDQLVGSSEGWEPPIPFADQRQLPAFPTSALPDAVEAMAASVAESTQTPVDLAAVIGLAALSAATVGRVRVVVRPGWEESTSVYALGLIGSANRKTAVVRAMTKPLRGLEAEMRDAARSSIETAEIEAKVKRHVRNAIAQQLKKSPADPALQQQLAQAEYDVMVAEAAVPPLPCLILDDATPEALTAEMARQGERLAVFDAEGGGLTTLAGARYGEAPYLDMLLKAHAGDPVSSARVGRGSVQMQRPCLAIGVLSQPETLKELRGIKGADDRGLIPRLLLAVPVDNLGTREIDPAEIEPSVVAAYDARLRDLAGNLWRQPDPVDVTFEDAARKRLLDFMAEIEPMLRPDGELRELGGFAGKLVGAAARYAVLHHLGHYGAAGLTIPVHEHSVARGIAIARYSIEHYRYATRANGWRPELELAQRILRWCRDGSRSEFSRRDVQNGLGVGTAAELDEPLTLLAEHGYVRALGVQRTQRRGRNPSERFAVNPAVTDRA